jgi:hypothetical protein
LRGMRPSPSIPGRHMSTDRPLPQFADYKTGAQIVSERCFPITARALEKWPLPVKIINRRRHVPTEALIAHAEAKIAAAPSVMANTPLHHSRRKPRLVAIEAGK